MIPEPSNELYAAVKAISNPWPPDNEDSAKQLGAKWKSVGSSATSASSQVNTQQRAVTSAWPDNVGEDFGSKLSGGAKALLQVSGSSNQLAESATKYAQALTEVKTAITKTIAANLPMFLQLGSPQAGAIGIAQRQALVQRLAAELKSMVDAKAGQLGAAPAPPEGKSVAGAIGDWAGVASSILGFAALIPTPASPFLGGLALASQGVALGAHAYDAANNPSDGNGWVGVASDALGFVPPLKGIKAAGGLVKSLKEAEPTIIDAVKAPFDVGAQVPVIVSQLDDSPKATDLKNATGVGSLGSSALGALAK